MDKNTRSLNELTAKEYYKDYKLYLENCDDPKQRNLKTYFAELEHQEGTVDPLVKTNTRNLVLAEMMSDVIKVAEDLVSDAKRWAVIMLDQDEEVLDPIDEMDLSHEAIQSWLNDYAFAMRRGIEKYC